MPNVATIIKGHNDRLTKEVCVGHQKQCNCRMKDLCPLYGECQANNIIYKAEVINTTRSESQEYIGLTENTFKQIYSNHVQSFKNPKYENSTEL